MQKLFMFTLIVILFSCSVSKRKYRTGYHVDWNKSTVKTQNKAKQNKIQQQSKHLSEPKQSELIAGADNKLALSPIKKPVSLIKSEDSCDVLILTDGTETKVKILEVNESEIRYKTCNYINGPTRVINKSSAFMIKFSNGTIQTFQTKNIPEQNIKKIKEGSASSQTKRGSNGNNRTPKTHPLAILSFIFGVISIAAIGFSLMIILANIWAPFILTITIAFIGFILYLIAKHNLKHHPNRYLEDSNDLLKNALTLNMIVLVIGMIFGLLYLLFILVAV